MKTEKAKYVITTGKWDDEIKDYTDSFMRVLFFKPVNSTNKSGKIQNFKRIARDIENELENIIEKYISLGEYQSINFHVRSFWFNHDNNTNPPIFSENYTNQHIEICVGKYIYNNTPGIVIKDSRKIILTIDEVKPVFDEIYNYIIQKYNI